MKGYITSIHKGMKYTLHELVFGRSARILVTYYLTGNESCPEYALFDASIECAKTSHENMQKLDLSDTTIVKQSHRYSRRMVMYICKRIIERQIR